MTADESVLPPATDIRVVEELFQVLAKGQRALQMYLPNNPVYQRTLQQVTEAFAPVWEVTERLVLDILEDQICWEQAPVFEQANKAEGLAWQLHKDGLRRLTLTSGVETEEIFRFLEVVNRARLLPTDAADDLLTLLWEQEFGRIAYTFVEVLGDGIEFIQERQTTDLADTPPVGDARAEVEEGLAAPEGSDDAKGGAHGVVDLDEFDATPYFLDEAEIRLIRTELEEEYSRDIQQAAVDALLDVLEAQQHPEVRQEAIALLEEILPTQLTAGGFRAVAHILRELRLIASRAQGLDETLQRAVLSFEERLSTPEILEQLFRVLADHSLRSTDEDVGEVLRELKASALPAVLAQLGRVFDTPARRVLESAVDEIARNQPELLAEIVRSGSEEALLPAISVAGRLGLTQLVPAIIVHTQAGAEPLRVAAVRALGELGTPTAISAIEAVLDDQERSIRQIALSLLLARGGSGGLLNRLEVMLFDGTVRPWERSERRTVFEAYGSIAGDAAVPKLRGLLEPRGIFRRRAAADTRASACFALAKIGSPDARAVVARFTEDKEPVVRSAASIVLREWPV